MYTFIWIQEGVYNLLNADKYKLPFRGWTIDKDNQLTHKDCDKVMVVADDSVQPNDPYLIKFNEKI